MRRIGVKYPRCPGNRFFQTATVPSKQSRRLAGIVERGEPLNSPSLAQGVSFGGSVWTEGVGLQVHRQNLSTIELLVGFL
jgi:hypothetical protein